MPEVLLTESRNFPTVYQCLTNVTIEDCVLDGCDRDPSHHAVDTGKNVDAASAVRKRPNNVKVNVIELSLGTWRKQHRRHGVAGDISFLPSKQALVHVVMSDRMRSQRNLFAIR